MLGMDKENYVQLLISLMQNFKFVLHKYKNTQLRDYS